MLRNLLGAQTIRLSYGRQKSDPSPAKVSAEKTSSTLKIVQVGGAAECYYMAVPAARIMEKSLSFILAKPDVFRTPWDCVVRPEEILIPGQKFFVVPRGTLRRLRRRIRSSCIRNGTNSFVSQSSPAEVVSQQEIDQPGTNIKSNGKHKARNCHVRFFGIDTIDGQESTSVNEMVNEKVGKS